jgi:hypothetical protein
VRVNVQGYFTYNKTCVFFFLRKQGTDRFRAFSYF